MAVDVEKLICFLMSDEVIENNIPESLKLGLEQQGLKCKDGKIHSISEKERSKKWRREISRQFTEEINEIWV